MEQHKVKHVKQTLELGDIVTEIAFVSNASELLGREVTVMIENRKIWFRIVEIEIIQEDERCELILCKAKNNTSVGHERRDMKGRSCWLLVDESVVFER